MTTRPTTDGDTRYHLNNWCGLDECDWVHETSPRCDVHITLAEQEVELERWKNIAASRLGDERKYLGKFRRALVSGSRVERHKAEIRRLTTERDALKDALGWDRSLEVLAALTPTTQDREGSAPG